ncbi:MAG: methyltransferase domain-containing protein [Chthoniobacterales bacterium]|nr:methyltransferase domain-containing protein [Chthoniobacterales bacterium]
MKFLRKLVSRFQGMLEQMFPNWAHQRHRHKWERQWADPNYSPFWKTERPQKEFVEAIESGWFDKNQRVLDVGCGNGEVSRWLSSQGYKVTGIDYSAAAIENCRRLAAGADASLKFDVADLCSDLRLDPAGSLLDRGCFHRIADNFRSLYAQNVARAAAPGGHFLLLSGTFQDARFANYRGARTEAELHDHVKSIFGKYFSVDRAETAVINASEDQEAMPAVAFWMTRNADLA